MKQTLLVVVLLAAAATARSHAQAGQVQLPLRLSGALISAGGIGNPTGTGRIEITISRWSTAAERSKLVTTLAQQGQDALLDELSRAKSVGTVRFNTGLAWDLRYAREVPRAEGGSLVYAATDRPMSAWEIWNDPQYSRYPFTLIELRFDRERPPDGSLLLAARVTADNDGRFVTVENFATQPIRITQIELQH